MTRSLILALFLSLTGSAAFAQGGLPGRIANQLNQAQQDRDQRNEQQLNEPATPASVKTADTGWIDYKAPNGTKIRLYVAHPFIAADAKPNLPALIVLHEWWGLTDDIAARADEFAGKGYFAVAVDLYNGKTTKDAKEAEQLKKDLADDVALGRMKLGMGYLYSQTQKKIVDANRIGVIGWCMGGGEALNLATNDQRIKATVVFYGTPITDGAKLKNMKGPVLGMFGDADESISTAEVDKFEAALKEANIPTEIHRYPNAPHAFASPAAAALGLYKPELAKDANEKTYAWLEKNLQKKP